MLLSNVLTDLEEGKKINFKKFNLVIKGIHCDSRKILKNFIFVAIKGENNDGHKYIFDAIKKGAIFGVIEKKKLETKFFSSYLTLTFFSACTKKNDEYVLFH